MSSVDRSIITNGWNCIYSFLYKTETLLLETWHPPSWFFRHLQQEDRLGIILYVVSISQVKRWFSVWGSFTHLERLPATGERQAHCSQAHTTSTPLTSVSEGLLQPLPGPEGFLFCAFLHQESGSFWSPWENSHSTLLHLLRSICPSYLRLSERACHLLYYDCEKHFASIIFFFSIRFIFYSWTQIPNRHMSRDCCKLTSCSLLPQLPKLGRACVSSTQTRFFPPSHSCSLPSDDLSLHWQFTLWDLK